MLEFCEFLRANGVDALIDVEVAVRPQDWPDWMSDQIRQGGYVLVIGTPDYRAAAEDRLAAQERKAQDGPDSLIWLGGAKGTRTPNPLLAKQVRYQLRHGPKVTICPSRRALGPRPRVVHRALAP